MVENTPCDREVEVLKVLGFFPLFFALSQVPRGGSTLLVFLINTCLAVQLEAKKRYRLSKTNTENKACSLCEVKNKLGCTIITISFLLMPKTRLVFGYFLKSYAYRIDRKEV